MVLTHQETLPRQVVDRISPRALLTANQSELALNNISKWQEAKNKPGGLTLVVLCSDARLQSTLMFDDVAIASVSTIAASGETEPIKFLLNHSSIGRVIVLGHYDGDKVDEIPVSGCGGLHGKNQQLETGGRTLFPNIDADDLNEFINQISHADVFLQTHLIAQKITQLREKPLPIIAAVVDHLSYKINPVSLILKEQGSLVSVTNPELKINPKKRKNQLPIISLDSLDENSAVFLKQNEKVMELLGQNDDFRKKQKTQNPQAVVLSTSPIPISLRYPSFFGKPNSAFVVRLPFSKQVTEEEVDDIKGKNHKITRKFLANASAQIKYPLQEAIRHLQEGAFLDTKTLIIETPDIIISQEIADYLAKMELIKKWIEKKSGQIIVTEVKSGVTTNNIYTYEEYSL